MDLRRFSLLLSLFFLLFFHPLTAGVVEDADEVLREAGVVTTTREAGRRTPSTTSPLPGERNVYRSSSQETTRSVQGKSRGSSTRSASGASRSESPTKDQVEKRVERPSHVIAEESKGRLVSWVVLFVLMLLAAAATMFANRRDGELEDQ